MCGITGFVDFSKKSNLNILKKMTDVLYHRGPDDSGYGFYENEFATIGLGQRRLSILDLSPRAHQPMSFEQFTIVYNGEVYNFKEIRKDLEQYGYTFNSDSDTEVILKAYHKWGVDAVHRFNGMFAIAIYDQQTKKLTLIRDRAGVKPLYWYQKDGLFMFASELKSFHENPGFEKEIDIDALSLFFQYGYILQPYSIFKNSFKLKAGHYIELDLKNNNLQEIKYWDVFDCYNQPKLVISEKEAIEETERLLKKAFEYRMVADVPVGMFLSGGYDSSAVTAILQSDRTEKLKTFTIGFYEDKFNEAHHAKKVAEYLGTNHTEYYCTQKDALEILPKLPEIWDEPFGDASAIPTTLVSQLARKHVTVSLSADGGDEIFGGYEKYTSIHKKKQAFSKIPNLLLPLAKECLNCKAIQFATRKAGMFDADDRLKRFALMLDKNEKGLLKISSQIFTDSDIEEILTKKPKPLKTEFDAEINQVWLDNIMAIDYKTYQLDDILSKVDRATMSVSLEGREPLLDYNVINFVARLDPSLKIRNGNKKYLLKEIVHKYLPKEIMDRPKMGFGVPIFNWFKDELKDYLNIYLDEQRVAKEGIFQPGMVVKIRDKYLKGENVNINKIWFLLMFEMWMERWMK